MLHIKKNNTDNVLDIIVNGSIDTLSVPGFIACIKNYDKKTEQINLDISSVDYLSFEGREAILEFEKKITEENRNFNLIGSPNCESIISA